MKKYKAKKIRKMNGNKPANITSVALFNGCEGTVNRRVKIVVKDKRENEQVSRAEDND